MGTIRNSVYVVIEVLNAVGVALVPSNISFSLLRYSKQSASLVLADQHATQSFLTLGSLFVYHAVREKV